MYKPTETEFNKLLMELKEADPIPFDPKKIYVPSIAVLNAFGFSPKVWHFRYYRHFDDFPLSAWQAEEHHISQRLVKVCGMWIEMAGDPVEILPQGGRTEVVVTMFGMKYRGSTVCSRDDHYVKRRGVRLATARALIDMIGEKAASAIAYSAAN